MALLPAPPVPAVRPQRHAASGGTPPGAVARGRAGALAAAGLVLVGVLVAALLVGGGRPVAPTAGLPDAGAVTGWGQPLVDLLVRVLAVLTVGQLTYAALLAPATPTGPGAGAVRALRGSAASAAGWLLAEAAALLLTASSLYGVPVTALSVQGVTGLLTGLPVGRSSLWVGLLLVVLVLGCASVSGGPPGARGLVRPVSPALLLLALAAVVVPVVLAGHSAAAADHVAAVVSLSVHVVTASVWVGGLVGLLLHGRDRSDVVVAVRRFSVLALACVVLLTASGVVAALLVAGAPTWSWTGEGWVRLLVVKTLLLAVLAAMGWWHRRRTLPALALGLPRAFVRLGVVEVGLMAVTVAVSVALAASPAPSPAAGAVVAGDGPAGVVTDGGGAPDGSAPGAPGDGTSSGPDAAAPGGAAAGDAGASAPSTPAEDMSGHDHGDLSVSVLVDAERFHVAAPVRAGQPVTVYNSSDQAATITALDGSFDVAVPARTFITFEAPAAAGEHPFVSRADGEDVAGFADVLRVRTAG